MKLKYLKKLKFKKFILPVFGKVNYTLEEGTFPLPYGNAVLPDAKSWVRQSVATASLGEPQTGERERNVDSVNTKQTEKGVANEARLSPHSPLLVGQTEKLQINSFLVFQHDCFDIFRNENKGKVSALPLRQPESLCLQNKVSTCQSWLIPYFRFPVNWDHFFSKNKHLSCS